MTKQMAVSGLKILLIGATGQLGGDLIRNNPGYEIIAPDRRELDLARPAEAAAMVEALRPAFVINCAAFHNVPKCEEDPAQAFMVNCAAVRDLAVACARAGAWLVNFSTDYVFGGDRSVPWREDDCPAPLQIYGISRLAGEHAALSGAPGRAIVIRTCGLYGRSGARSKGGNFVDGRVADVRPLQQRNSVALSLRCLRFPRLQGASTTWSTKAPAPGTSSRARSHASQAAAPKWCR
jgi:dTDP-4-dehydrorhamnose reductase